MKYSFLQMNILAKDLCDKKSFPFVKEDYLNWEYRIKLFKTLFLEKEKEKDFSTKYTVYSIQAMKKSTIITSIIQKTIPQHQEDKQ